MSTATVTDLTLPEVGGRHHFLLRRLHSLTGLLFGGYIVVHLLINATLMEGKREGSAQTVFDVQVGKIHSLPFLVPVEWLLIYLPILYHTVYGAWITFTGQPNVGRYPYGKNYFYFFQRVSAIVIALFIVFHVLAMKGALNGLLGKDFEFDPNQATVSTLRHFHANAFVLYFVYPLGILASTYHLANGFWTAAITWGLTVSKGSQRRWGFACVGLFVLTFACGMIAWASTIYLPGREPPALQPHAPVEPHPAWIVR